jgi:MinD superfamily P-loop ATPase
VVRTLGLPHGVVINRDGVGDDGVEDYCREEGIRVLMKIPQSREIARLYSQGKPFVPDMPDWNDRFGELWIEMGREAEAARDGGREPGTEDRPGRREVDG